MQKKNNDGFTLIEILIVVAVIGVMAAVAIPMVSSWQPNMRLKAAARDLFSNMQTMRLDAVKFNRNTAIIFDTANNSYELCDDWDNADTSGTVPTCNGEVVNLTNSRYGIGYGYGNAAKQADDAGTAFPLSPDDDVSYGSNVAIFNSRGLGNNDGYAYLDHQDNTTSYTIGSLISGVIKLHKWKGSKWE